jgi:hypothetical protein
MKVPLGCPVVTFIHSLALLLLGVSGRPSRSICDYAFSPAESRTILRRAISSSMAARILSVVMYRSISGA